MVDKQAKRVKEAKRIKTEHPLLISELEDEGPFVLIPAPKIGTPVAEEQASDDLATQRTPRTEKVA